MNNPTVSRISYAVLFILNLAIVAFLVQVAKGEVPFPDGWDWAIPILVAILNGVAAFLPKYGNEPLAVQAHDLHQSGVPRERMLVIDRRAHAAELQQAERRGIEQARAHQTPPPGPLRRPDFLEAGHRSELPPLQRERE